MNIQRLLEIAGPAALHNFPWAEKAVSVINAQLPAEQQIALTAKGTDVLETLQALPVSVNLPILSAKFDLRSVAGYVMEEIDTAVADPVKARGLKFKIVTGLIVCMALIVVATVVMTLITSTRTGQAPDTTLVKEVFGLLFELVKIMLGLDVGPTA